MIFNRIYLYFFNFIIMILFSQNVLAENYESIENIKNFITQFVINNTPINPGDHIEVKLTQLSSFSQLPACTKELEGSLPKNIYNNDHISSIELSCKGENAWHVLIPIDAQISTKVIVSKRTISAQETIREEDVEYAFRDKKLLHNGYFTDANDVVGQIASRVIINGKAIAKNNLQASLLIRRNQIINLTIKKDSILVSMKGVAKSDGALNEVVKVYNPSSKKSVDAIVTGPSKAEIVV